MIHILIYVLLINFITLLLYSIDKRRAKKKKWRIAEAILILMSLIGGSVGALIGMYGLRHKTKHFKFKILIPMFFVFHVALFVVICVVL